MNYAGHEHAITTSDIEPVFLTYAWVGEAEALHKFNMTLEKAAPKRGLSDNVLSRQQP